MPGEDAEQFSAEHGPGYGEKGPETFPYIGMKEHPRRGNKWKFGATMNRVPRFGQTVPSRRAAHDHDLAGMSFLTHEGRRPVSHTNDNKRNKKMAETAAARHELPIISRVAS